MYANSPPRSRAWPGLGPRDSTSRRRWVLLAVIIAVPAALVVLGLPSAWPLLVVPLIVAAPLAGTPGLATAAAVTALTIAMASGAEAVSGPQLAVGLVAFIGAGILVAAGSAARERELARIWGSGVIDRLTGLRNHGVFADTLPRDCRRSSRYEQPLSLVVLDLDGFEELSRRHGHATANQLLAAAGRAIGASACDSDLPARLGGEAFAVIVPGPAAEAGHAAEQLRAAVAGVRVAVDGGELAVTASAGVAEYDPAMDGDGEALLARAVAALERSKREGRDRTTASARQSPIRAAA